MARRAALAALAVATAALTTGCGAVGRSTGGDASAGKALFGEKCASCHTLEDANAQGTIGPNLDDAFESVKEQKFDESTIRDVVRGQIAYPEDPMPANLVRGGDADAVAAYVAKCAGVASCGVQASAQKPPAQTTTTTGGGGGAAGKQVFTANCGGCHTLADAGTSGNVGPNLDDAKPTKARAATQVANGGGGMPAFKGRLSAAEIDAVATYVSSVAGK